jgi:hypothetical protein
VLASSIFRRPARSIKYIGTNVLMNIIPDVAHDPVIGNLLEQIEL